MGSPRLGARRRPRTRGVRLPDGSIFARDFPPSADILDRLRYIGNTFEVESLPLKEAYEELSDYTASTK